MEFNENSILSEEIFQMMVKDKKIRTAITKKSHKHFFHFYLAHYVKYKTAPFHNEIFEMTENEQIGNFFITAFRSCGKSTLITTSYPIWAILGEQQKKFVLIICQTQSQARQHMSNLRRELESNALLKSDLGPFEEDSSEWGSTSLVFSNSKARITIASSEQSIRGLRHNQYRPDLIICDDIEDIASTKTREGRNKTCQWLTSEVIPAGDKDTRLVIIGNLLHEDSLLMRLKEDIANKKIDGVFKEYPLVRGNEILWPGKYPTMDDVEREKRKAGNEYSWQMEYLLKIVPTEDQVIHRDWINFYDDIIVPTKNSRTISFTSNGGIRIGVDLAISLKESADFTAMVPAKLVGSGEDTVIYILPNIINRRLTFPDTVELCRVLNKTYTDDSGLPTLAIEDVGYQKALPQQLANEGIYNVLTINPGNADKRSRLLLTAHMIKSGKILFPRTGCEELINQIVNFGIEKHDDLADAFSCLILSVIKYPPSWSGIIF